MSSQFASGRYGFGEEMNEKDVNVVKKLINMRCTTKESALLMRPLRDTFSELKQKQTKSDSLNHGATRRDCILKVLAALPTLKFPDYPSGTKSNVLRENSFKLDLSVWERIKNNRYQPELTLRQVLTIDSQAFVKWARIDDSKRDCAREVFGDEVMNEAT